MKAALIWIVASITAAQRVAGGSFANQTEEQKLVASDGASADGFGGSVSVDGDAAVMGAVSDNDNGSSSGSAYVFRLDEAGWLAEQKLLASDGEASDDFGVSVSISGPVLLIGAFGDDDKGSGAGAAYVFHFDGASWVEEQKLFASDGVALAEFGRSVAVDGDVVVVGARYDPESALNAGAAYSFRFDGMNWVEVQKLVASDGATASGQLGSRVGQRRPIGRPGCGFRSGSGLRVRCSGARRRNRAARRPGNPR